MRPIPSSLLLATVVLAASAASPALAQDFQTGQSADVVLGQPNFATDATSPVSATLSTPIGIAVSPVSGKVFISDFTRHRILRYSSEAAARNGSFPEIVLGQSNFSGSAANADGLGANTFNGPFGVFVDSFDRLWVPDPGNNRVLRFDNASNIATNAPADQVLGQPDFSGFASATTPSRMDFPTSVFLDSDGQLWVVDQFNSRVLRFDDAASKPNGANADGVLGQAQFTTKVAAGGAAGMNRPIGIIGDATSTIWVADADNNRVLRFDNAAGKPNGGSADAVLGQTGFDGTSADLAANRMNFPHGFALDPRGRLWVAERGNSRVLRFDNAASRSSGANADFVLGQPDFVTNAPGLSAQKLLAPRYLALNASGQLWVTDGSNNRALRFSPVLPPAPPALAAAGKTKIGTTKARIVLKGSATDATLVEFQSGKGGFQKTKGSASNWKIPLRLEPGRNIVKVRATGPGGNSRVLRFLVLRSDRG